MTPALFTLHFGGNDFAVQTECLGVNSMASMVALAVFLAVLNRLAFRRACALVVCGMGLAVAQNAARIAVIVSCAMVDYGAATTVVHDYCGYVTFIVAALFLGRVADGMVRRNLKG